MRKGILLDFSVDVKKTRSVSQPNISTFHQKKKESKSLLQVYNHQIQFVNGEGKKNGMQKKISNSFCHSVKK